MKTNVIAARALGLMLLLPLAACSQSGSQSGNDAHSDVAQAVKEVQQQTSPSVIGAEIQKGIEEGKKELLTQDIDVTSVRIGKNPDKSANTRPKAVITPQGNLVI